MKVTLFRPFPDQYRFMDAELVGLLEAKLWHLLPEKHAADRR